MRALIRKALYGIAPDAMRLRAAGKRRAVNRRLFGDRQTKSRRRLFDGTHIQILTGPFAGMRYIDEMTWGPIEPKWLGTYEFELHAIVSDILRAGYRTVIDVGSAEGFYSVGIAWKNPDSSIIAFDVDPISRDHQKSLAALNDVRNLEIRTLCSHADLEALVTERTLVVCDIEGGELDLLDPTRAPSLRRSDILVEIHETGDRSIHEVEVEIARRFADSHAIAVVAFDPNISARKASMNGALRAIDDDLFDECRLNDSQTWLWMTHT